MHTRPPQPVPDAHAGTSGRPLDSEFDSVTASAILAESDAPISRVAHWPKHIVRTMPISPSRSRSNKTLVIVIPLISSVTVVGR